MLILVKYLLLTQLFGDNYYFCSDEPSVIPGMGPDDKVDVQLSTEDPSQIPGLDLDIISNAGDDKANKLKKVPYSKPIPRNFQAQWNETTGKYFSSHFPLYFISIFGSSKPCVHRRR